ncbi:hypothetical protein B2J93_7591 [Marssonina coronariae]|uniref:Exonuclease V n=1 Tax=Diplocarpon coronariae TaxID=2795749 RepID=A0A218Z7Q6_9HELO|nr:hypothetical protein B2J93_7591 [Marssonina coronariae]
MLNSITCYRVPGSFATRDHRRQHSLFQLHQLSNPVGMGSPSNAELVQNIDTDTDYGSDFSPEEEQIVEGLLTGKHIEGNNPLVSEIEHHDPRQTLRLPHVNGTEQRSPLFQAARAAERVAEQIAEIVQGGEYKSLDWSDQYRHRAPETGNDGLAELPKEDLERPDLRSPLERFRTRPKKALSVSDLVAPAWCELQFWYILTKHGKKKRTPAMRGGTRVHKELENQVHTTVKVDVQTKEDAWAVRIWNVIQGLRTLRDTGQTRELEIWGIVDGQVVNGVIDELSYICPDIGLEASSKPPKKDLLPNQTTIADYFKTAGAKSLKKGTRSQRPTKTKKIYLCDVKTRGIRTLPSASALKPTRIQLMLYHRLLASLATNTVELSVLAARYSFDTNKLLSDEFITQIGNLNVGLVGAPTDRDSSLEPETTSSQESVTIVHAHNTLNLLWSLMIEEFRLTLPEGADSLGRVLKVEFRSRDDGEIVGTKTLLMDDRGLTKFIDHEMEWWQGQRQAEGVEIEEAFKCSGCDFAEECEWRIKKVDEARKKAKMARKTSSAA